MRCFRFRSSPQPHARNSPIPRPVRLSQSPSHLVSGPGSSRSLRRSLCGRKHKILLACPSLSEKNLNSTGLWASLVPRQGKRELDRWEIWLLFMNTVRRGQLVVGGIKLATEAGEIERHFTTRKRAERTKHVLRCPIWFARAVVHWRFRFVA